MNVNTCSYVKKTEIKFFIIWGMLVENTASAKIEEY